jgi:hypothetical protein
MATSCTAAQTRSTFAAFVRAYNADDLQTLDRLWPTRRHSS